MIAFVAEVGGEEASVVVGVVAVPGPVAEESVGAAADGQTGRKMTKSGRWSV